jgi:hypothetical protein
LQQLGQLSQQVSPQQFTGQQSVQQVGYMSQQVAPQHLLVVGTGARPAALSEIRPRANVRNSDFMSILS